MNNSQSSRHLLGFIGLMIVLLCITQWMAASVYAANTAYSTEILPNGYLKGDALQAENGTPPWSSDPSVKWQPLTSTGVEMEEKGGWVWFRMILPPQRVRDHSLSVQVAQLFEVYTKDHGLIYQFGDMDKLHYQGTPRRIVPLPDEIEDRTLYFRVYSQENFIGFIDTTYYSSEPDLLRSSFQQYLFTFVISLFYLFMGFGSILAYYAAGRLRLYLIFGAFITSFGVYTATRTSIIYWIGDWPKFWMYVELGSLMLGSIYIIRFVGNLINSRCTRVYTVLWLIHFTFGLLYGLVTLFGRDITLQTLSAYQLLIAGSLLYVIIDVVRHAWSGHRDARYILAGFILMAGAGLIDIMDHMNGSSWDIPNLMNVGILSFVCSLVLVLILRLQEMNQKLKRNEKLSIAGQLAAGIAHEIRNPVTVISGFLQLFRQKANEQQLKYVDMMLDETRRVDQIIEEFLMLAKPTTMYQRKTTQLSALLDEVLMMYEMELHHFDIEVIRHYPDSFPSVECEPNQIKQVFINIIKNAIDAMPCGGGQLRVHLVMEGRKQIIVRIEDTGEGIDEKLVHKVGDPFFTTKKHGTGLGLMICQKIAEFHKGSLRMSSVKNVGTKVELYLPM